MNWIELNKQEPDYYTLNLVLADRRYYIAWLASDGEENFFTVYGKDIIIKNVSHWCDLKLMKFNWKHPENDLPQDGFDYFCLSEELDFHIARTFQFESSLKWMDNWNDFDYKHFIMYSIIDGPKI